VIAPEFQFHMPGLSFRLRSILVTLFADVHLWLAVAGVPPPGLQPHKTSGVAALSESMRVFDRQHIRQRD